MCNQYLSNSFYVDVNKNIMSYFQSLVKEMKHPLFLIHFGKQLEDKLRLGVGLGGCDKKTVVARGV